MPQQIWLVWCCFTAVGQAYPEISKPPLHTCYCYPRVREKVMALFRACREAWGSSAPPALGWSDKPAVWLHLQGRVPCSPAPVCITWGHFGLCSRGCQWWLIPDSFQDNPMESKFLNSKMKLCITRWILQAPGGEKEQWDFPSPPEQEHECVCNMLGQTGRESRSTELIHVAWANTLAWHETEPGYGHCKGLGETRKRRNSSCLQVLIKFLIQNFPLKICSVVVTVVCSNSVPL